MLAQERVPTGPRTWGLVPLGVRVLRLVTAPARIAAAWSRPWGRFQRSAPCRPGSFLLPGSRLAGPLTPGGLPPRDLVPLPCLVRQLGHSVLVPESPSGGVRPRHLWAGPAQGGRPLRVGGTPRGQAYRPVAGPVPSAAVSLVWAQPDIEDETLRAWADPGVGARLLIRAYQRWGNFPTFAVQMGITNLYWSPLGRDVVYGYLALGDYFEVALALLSPLATELVHMDLMEWYLCTLVGLSWGARWAWINLGWYQAWYPGWIYMRRQYSYLPYPPLPRSLPLAYCKAAAHGDNLGLALGAALGACVSLVLSDGLRAFFFPGVDMGVFVVAVYRGGRLGAPYGEYFSIDPIAAYQAYREGRLRAPYTEFYRRGPLECEIDPWVTQLLVDSGGLAPEVAPQPVLAANGLGLVAALPAFNGRAGTVCVSDVDVFGCSPLSGLTPLFLGWSLNARCGLALAWVLPPMC